MNKTKTCLLLALLIVGCNKQPTVSWKISLIKPDGVVYESYTLESSKKPVIYGSYGGQLAVYNGNVNTGIYAPTGWFIKVNEE